MIILKNERDFEAMRPACAVAASSLSEVAGFHAARGQPDARWIEYAAVADQSTTERGAPFWAIGSIRATFVISVNDQVVHGLAGDQRQLQFGDIVSLDVGVIYDGFIGDTRQDGGGGRLRRCWLKS